MNGILIRQGLFKRACSLTKKKPSLTQSQHCQVGRMSCISLKGKQRFLLVFFAIIMVASPQSQRKHFSGRNRNRSKSCRDAGPAPPHPTPPPWSALDVVNSFENSINSSRFIRARVYYIDRSGFLTRVFTNKRAQSHSPAPRDRRRAPGLF